MKNIIKYYLLITLMIGTLSVGIPAMAEGELPVTQSPAAQTEAQAPTPPAVEEPASKPEIPTKKPIGKKQLAMKFIMAMIGVGVSSVIIFVLLSGYNKFVYGSYTRVEPSEEDNSYKTPNNMKDAINIFLKKTK